MNRPEDWACKKGEGDIRGTQYWPYDLAPVTCLGWNQTEEPAFLAFKLGYPY